MADLPTCARALVVVAHPDDESFGLGAVLHRLAELGADVHVLCLTQGEASTHGASPDLARIRKAELATAARELGLGAVTLLDHPDGGLADLDDDVLVRAVEEALEAFHADHLVIFDPEAGVTGHPDHRAASLAALSVAARHRIPVLSWALPADVAATLNDEYGTGFHGYADVDLDVRLTVDRAVQRRAIAAHASQAVPGSVLWRRLELLGDTEYLRILD